jgi:hypothetical protein
MTAGEADTAGDLGRLLAEKIALFNDLNSATGALCESFARRDIGEIERLIAARGELAARVDGLDDRIRGLNVKFPAYVAALEGIERDRFRALVRELQDATKKAVDLDNSCAAAAAAAFEILGSDISRMRQEKHSFNSYSGQGGRTKMLDIKS